ncbi:MAG: hypothetical protein AAF639_22755 [Chloroflexota bacterium]
MNTQNKILQAGKKYTFQDYFELKYPTEDILRELGYGYAQTALALPQIDIGSFAALQNAMIKRLPKVTLNSETARREFYVSPFIWDLLDRLDFRIKVEYPVEVSDHLRGLLDYLLQLEQNVVVVEAKKADVDRGFTQLAVELIAVSQSVDNMPATLYGAVTTGNLWQFGMLDTTNKMVYRDVNEFLILQHMDELACILTGILSLPQSS